MTSFRLVTLVTGICALTACGHGSPEEVQTEAVVPVTVEAAAVGTIQSTARVTGVVEPAPGADLIVSAPASARIVEIPKAEGDTVRRGDLLVRFEIPSLVADAASKRAEIDRANARLQNARSAQARAKDLFERGVGARKELEDADRELADAEAALAEAKANLAAASTLEGRSVMRATFDGLVAKRSHNPGDLVEPGAGDPVLRVIDPQRLEISAAVQFADVPNVLPGAAARVRVTGSGDPAPARVASRAAAVDPATGAASVRLRFDRPTRLAVGTPVLVEIDTEARRNAIVVPVAAIVREGAETAVFVAAGNKAQRRSIEVGLSDGEHIEVLKGVKAGELVITRGQNGLPDGAQISTGAEGSPDAKDKGSSDAKDKGNPGAKDKDESAKEK
jgi:RND family efflux transporter MFP subunit